MPRNARQEGFSRRHRFAEQGSFGPILRSPRKLRGRYTVVHALSGRPGESRLGVALTRRLVASSVQRNLLKRHLRETFRRHPLKRAGLDCVVTLREKFHDEQLHPLVEEIRGLFDRLAQGDGR